jgi:alkylation response protein AidB-like acyl-CoA dehydrogenase
MQFTHEHQEIQKTLKRFIDEKINPHVDEWEAAEIFPAHEVFKGLGQLGLLGLTKPEEFGGAGLDYSYAMAMAETLGHIHCGGVPMAIGVQTDMATPALARFGSEELKREFLAPAIAGDMVSCIGVSEPGAGSDVSAIRSHARKDGDDYVITGQKMWITNSLAGRLDVHAGQHRRGPAHKNKSLVIVPMREKGKLRKGIEVAQKIRKIGMNSSDTGLIYFDEVRVPQRNRIGAEGQGFIYQMQQFQEERLWAAGQLPAVADQLHRVDRRVGAGAQAVRRRAGRPAVGAVQAGETQDRGGEPARAHLPRRRAVCERPGRAGTGVDGQAARRAAQSPGAGQLPAVLGRHGLHLGEQGLAHVPRRPTGLDRRWRG